VIFQEVINDDDVFLVDDILSKIKLLSVSDRLKELNINNDDKSEWLFDNAWRICQSATSESVLKLANKKRESNKNKIFSVKSSTGILYLVKSDYSFESRKPRLQLLFADQNLEIHPGDFWSHIKTTGLDNEGFVPFKNGKKPLNLLKDLIKSTVYKSQEGIFLDFFSGSASTAEAVISLNSHCGANLKFIQIQIPEDLERSYNISTGSTKKQIKETLDFLRNNSLSLKLTELGKERIRRAGQKILEENAGKDGIENLDIGFRVLKVDSTNMKDVYYTPDSLNKTTLDLFESNIKADRTDEDLLFQVMLDWGLELSLPIEPKQILDKTVYFVAGNSLVACFQPLSIELIDQIAQQQPLRFVSAERAIMNDHDKTNIRERFKQLSPETDVKFL